MKTFFSVVTERDIITSAKAGLFVGSIIAIINYGDRIFLYQDMETFDWLKIAITYCVPYCVATYGAAKYAFEVCQQETRQHAY
jgi:hypothetical protein